MFDNWKPFSKVKRYGGKGVSILTTTSTTTMDVVSQKHPLILLQTLHESSRVTERVSVIHFLYRIKIIIIMTNRVLIRLIPGSQFRMVCVSKCITVTYKSDVIVSTH